MQIFFSSVLSLPIPKRFGNVVRALRQEKSWSQEFLAQQTKLHRNYIGAVERGERNISLKNIERLAEALGVPISGMFRKMENNLNFPPDKSLSRTRSGRD